MSDVRRIEADRKAQRDATMDPAMRRAAAAEQSADALEGIRQDMTALLLAFGQLQKQLTELATRK
jgi:uncharacterized protein involved in exopolysaccharide biosynthesis